MKWTRRIGMDGRLVGAASAAVVGLVAIAMGQPNPGGGFDCVIQPTTQICQACSGCTIVDLQPVCGTIKASAFCLGENLIAHCWIDVVNGVPQYHAECLVSA